MAPGTGKPVREQATALSETREERQTRVTMEEGIQAQNASVNSRSLPSLKSWFPPFLPILYLAPAYLWQFPHPPQRWPSPPVGKELLSALATGWFTCWT